MKKKTLISLSRNKIKNKNLNLFLSSSGKGEKDGDQNQLFKTTTQEESKTKTIPSIINKYERGLKKKDINIIFSVKNYDKYIKMKYMSDFSSKFLLRDDSDSKITSPISNTIRYNHSIQRFKHNNYSITKYRESTSYSGYNLIKLNKPYLLKLLNKQARNKTLNFKDSSLKLLTERNNTSKMVNPFFLKQSKNFDYNYNNTIDNEKMQMNEYLSKQSNKINSLENLYQKRDIEEFKKLSKIKVNFPLQFQNNVSLDKMELRDKVNSEFFHDENIKRKLRKALYYEINAFDFDNGIYAEYKKSIPNYINFIYDINILPHLQNKFLYNKPISKLTEINEIIFNRNAIRKEVAKAINRYIINNIRKEILEKEEIAKREKKLRELAKSNKILLKLYLEQKDENLPDLTSGEMVELDDYFSKNIDYKFVNISNNKLKNVVYNENEFFKSKRKNK